MWSSVAPYQDSTSSLELSADKIKFQRVGYELNKLSKTYRIELVYKSLKTKKLTKIRSTFMYHSEAEAMEATSEFKALHGLKVLPTEYDNTANDDDDSSDHAKIAADFDSDQVATMEIADDESKVDDDLITNKRKPNIHKANYKNISYKRRICKDIMILRI